MINMSEIQCHNITSSKKNKKGKDHKKLHKSLDAIKQIIKDSVEIENSKSDKTAILKLVKRNLQKMCLTKTGSEKLQEVFIVENRFTQQAVDCSRVEFSDVFNSNKHIISNYDYDRSKSTKELLRKTILEKRRSFELCHDVKEKDFCIEFKQKIWRPW